MKLRTPITAWRTTFFATLGLTPLVACSGSDHTGTADAGSSGGAATTGGSTSAGGNSSGGSAGSGGVQTAGGAAGKGGGGVSAGGVAGASSGGAGAGGAAGGNGGSSGNGGSRASGGSSGGIAGADGGDGTDAGHLACRNPMPRLGPDGMPTGFVDCEGGFTHRPEKRTCGSSIPRSVQCTNPNPQLTGNCTHDSDCTAHPLGYCQLTSGPAAATCACQYGCTTDTECGAGELCGCADPVGACVPTQNCTSDADCGPGLLCITSSDGGCGYTFACQTSKDTCTTSADCDVSSVCAFVTDHHECSPRRICGTGRPFLVAGDARVAPIVKDRAWTSSIVPFMGDLDHAARAALAAHWTQIALMEHASIAAFARFALELLSLGAPPELLTQAHRALADETTHARDAFALASAYAGEAVGPGPLSMQGAMDSRSFDEIVETAVLEGCIGETVAALEASEALAFATDEAVRAALSRVAEDEARHAELAYRFVRWALEVSPKAKKNALERRILALLGAAGQSDAPEGPTRDIDAPLLARHGLLPSHTRTLIRALSLSEVVAPGLAGLVAAAQGAVANADAIEPAQPRSAACRIDA